MNAMTPPWTENTTYAVRGYIALILSYLNQPENVARVSATAPFAVLETVLDMFQHDLYIDVQEPGATKLRKAMERAHAAHFWKIDRTAAVKTLSEDLSSVRRGHILQVADEARLRGYLSTLYAHLL